MWESYDYTRELQKKYQKKHPNAQPVTITGSKIASSFWGKAWCDHLKYYADYDNRVGRGRTYLRNGKIFDLTIKKGTIRGVVAGNGNRPYRVKIDIDPLEDQRLVRQMSGHLDSLEVLASGQFPKKLAEQFLTSDNGLFPDINALHLHCTCPDWAYMCKHVSAVLYGVGTKLDHEPLLLFELRGIDTATFIKKSVEEKMTNLLQNAENVQSDRIINDEHIFDFFDL